MGLNATFEDGHVNLPVRISLHLDNKKQLLPLFNLKSLVAITVIAGSSDTVGVELQV